MGEREGLYHRNVRIATRTEFEIARVRVTDVHEAREFGVAFSDPIEGAFLIIVTKDAGRNWREVPRELLPHPVEGEAGFAASGTCVCVREGQIWIGTGGTAARVLHSGDRGRSWSVVPTPAQVPLTQKSFSVHLSPLMHVTSLDR